jgi:hypothetical protein
MNSFILQDVRLFDGDVMIERTSVRIENGLIAEINTDITTAGIPVLSKPGHTLLPGLIDAHSHPYGDPRGPEQVFRFGITTLMDLQNPHENAVLQKKWAVERRDFPDIKSCHFAATIENGWPAWIEDQLGVAPVCMSSDANIPFRIFTDQLPSLAVEILGQMSKRRMTRIRTSRERSLMVQTSSSSCTREDKQLAWAKIR